MRISSTFISSFENKTFHAQRDIKYFRRNTPENFYVCFPFLRLPKLAAMTLTVMNILRITHPIKSLPARRCAIDRRANYVRSVFMVLDTLRLKSPL